jgi:cell division protein FtsN
MPPASSWSTTKNSSWPAVADRRHPPGAAHRSRAAGRFRAGTADAAPGASSRVDYTFYGILPGDKPAKPIPLPESKDIWWLQVAALKSPADADKLKARLLLLGLEVATQKVDSAADRFTGFVSAPTSVKTMRSAIWIRWPRTI